MGREWAESMTVLFYFTFSLTIHTQMLVAKPRTKGHQQSPSLNTTAGPIVSPSRRFFLFIYLKVLQESSFESIVWQCWLQWLFKGHYTRDLMTTRVTKPET